MGYYFAVVPHCRQKELYHFGIKGMKWGIRRYRNKDGSYTTAGKVRYGKKRTRRPSHDRLIASRDADEIYKYRKYYTDQELQGRLNRLNTEENIYRKTKVAKRREMIRNVASNTVKAAFVAAPMAVGAYNLWRDVEHPGWREKAVSKNGKWDYDKKTRMRDYGFSIGKAISDTFLSKKKK